MPWKLKKVDGGFKVVKKDGGEGTYSKHPQSKAKATAQLRALYASEGRKGHRRGGARKR